MNSIAIALFVLFLSPILFPVTLFTLRFDDSRSSQVGFIFANLGWISLPLLIVGSFGFIYETMWLEPAVATLFGIMFIAGALIWVTAIFGCTWALIKHHSK